MNKEKSRCTGCGQTLRKSGKGFLACKCMWIALKDKLSYDMKFTFTKDRTIIQQYVFCLFVMTIISRG